MGFLVVRDPTIIRTIGAQWSSTWTHTGDTNEALLTSVKIPAGTIGLNGFVEITASWTVTNNGNAKTVRIRFGAANDLTGTQFRTQGISGVRSYESYCLIGNRATNSQIAHQIGQSSSFGTSATAGATGAIDTTADTWVVFSGQLGVGTDTVGLNSYSVKVIPGV